MSRDRVRVAAYALCRDDAGRVLLCHIAPSVGAGDIWTLPGGGLEFGELPADAALRELEEEAGLVGELEGVADVLAWSDTWRHPSDGIVEAYHAIQVVYRARIVGGMLRNEPDGSTDRAAWFSLGELADLPLVPLAREGARLAFGAALPTS